MARWMDDTTMKFVLEYIKYESLWNANNEHYKNRQARQAIYSEIESVMGIQGFGEREVAQKIKNIRSTYAQELKKILVAQRCGKLYTPSLKWFQILHNALKPLQDNDKEIITDETETEMKTIIAENSDEYEHNQSAEELIVPITKRPMTPPSPPRKRKKAQELQSFLTNLKGIAASSKRTEEENEFEALGRNIGLQLKSMPLSLALEAQAHIQSYLSRLRIKHLKAVSPATVFVSTLEDCQPSSPSTSSNMYCDIGIKEEYLEDSDLM